MKKIFNLILTVLVLLVCACTERQGVVVLDSFIPRDKEKCEIDVDTERFYTRGFIDLAFTRKYNLAFRVTNHLLSSKKSTSDNDLEVSVGENNYFYAEFIEIWYEWNSIPQIDGRQLRLNFNLWQKRKVAVHGVIITPDGGKNAWSVDIFTEVQAKDLLQHVNDIDWGKDPLVVKLRVTGSLTDGTVIKTNTLGLNIEPSFGKTVQSSSVYKLPENKPDEPDEPYACKIYRAMANECAFQKPLLNGCLLGQDGSNANCYAGDSPWMKYIAESRCYPGSSVPGCYHPGLGSYSVIEIIFNVYKKSDKSKAVYRCCPSELPPLPKECEQESENQQQS